MLSFPLSATILLCLSAHASAAPQVGTGQAAGQTMILRKLAPKTTVDGGVRAKAHRESLLAKYGDGPPQKRSPGTSRLTNQNIDSSYFGSLAIGTPPTSYNVILDTGSSDLWVAGVDCTTGCEGVPTFNSSASSTFQNQSTPFSITYGSGNASGSLGQDIVEMAGFSVINQIFAVCYQVSTGLLSSPVSGLLGLAFQTIAASKADPLWQTFVSSGVWESPLMSFHLTRYINSTFSPAEVPGGSFSMGFANESLYTGDIEYIDMPVQGSYWILEITSIKIQGNTINTPSGEASYAAIDTGTTLIGGPSEEIAKIFAQIPGSSPGTGPYQNYFTYPCDTVIDFQLSFGGGRSWTIDPADFRLQKLASSSNQCIASLFAMDTGSSAPSWIVGDTFLKNVYSVFRYNPLSIGFAQLSDIALAENGLVGDAPTPTIASVATTVSASAPGSTSTKNSATSSSHHQHHPASYSAFAPVTAFCTASLAAAGYLF